jgi:Phasin protein
MHRILKKTGNVMASNPFNTGMQSYFREMPLGEPKALIEAQQMTLETMARLSNLTYNYAMELNKTWLDLCKDQWSHYSAWPQRLAECRTPDEVVKAHADLIGQATQDYKQGFDRLAAAGEEIARETSNAMERGQDAVRDIAGQTAKVIKKSAGEAARAPH